LALGAQTENLQVFAAENTGKIFLYFIHLLLGFYNFPSTPEYVYLHGLFFPDLFYTIQKTNFRIPFFRFRFKSLL
jgi:hypothetical protein